MFGLLTWAIITILAISTIYVLVDLLSDSTAQEEIKKASRNENKYGPIQVVIDSTSDNCAKFSLSQSGSKFANLHVEYRKKSAEIYSGRKLSTYA